jgi:hypothetical protein
MEISISLVHLKEKKAIVYCSDKIEQSKNPASFSSQDFYFVAVFDVSLRFPFSANC